MILIIAGPRDLDLEDVVIALLDGKYNISQSEGREITKVIAGDATGVDKIAHFWADAIGLPHQMYKADWENYGKVAGPIRNRDMAFDGDLLWAFKVNGHWSRGTSNMVSHMERLYKPVIVIPVTVEENHGKKDGVDLRQSTLF